MQEVVKLNKDDRLIKPEYGTQGLQVYRKDGVNRFFEIKNSIFDL